MTITSTATRQAGQSGTGAQTAFTYSFRILDEDDIGVYIEDANGDSTLQTITTHYTVAGVGDAGGGTITFVTAPADTETVHIVLNRDLTQANDLANDTAEGYLDELVIQIKTLADQANRAVKAAITESSGPTLPAYSANALFAWSGTEDGKIVNKTVVSVGDLTFPSSNTDNALIKADGTDGLSYQSTDVIIDDSSNITGVTSLTIGNEYSDDDNVYVTNHSNGGNVLTLKSGSKSQSLYDTSDDPNLWSQKFTQYDKEGDPFGQHVGGGLFEVYVDGSNTTGSTENEGTWIGLLGNAVLATENQGTEGSPDWDAKGSVIGVAGFARNDGYPGNGQIITGLWGYAVTPELTSTEFSNLPGSETSSTVGAEVNVYMRHEDSGARSVLAGHGNTAGLLLHHHRYASDGVRDWTFGIVFNGSPDDGDYTSTDIDNWSGFETGILLDKVKTRGILFGQYFADNSIGIEFPTSFAGSERPVTGISMGNSQINLGSYNGTANNGDLYRNASGVLKYKTGDVDGSVIVTDASGNVGLGASSDGEIFELRRSNGSGNVGVRFLQTGQVEYKMGIDDGDDLFYLQNNNGDSDVGSGTGGFNLNSSGYVTFPLPPTVPTYAVAGVPAASTAAGQIAYVSNGAAGSPILAFSDGTNWLRSDTGAAISSS